MFRIEIRSIFKEIMNNPNFQKQSTVNPLTTATFSKTDIFFKKKFDFQTPIYSEVK